MPVSSEINTIVKENENDIVMLVDVDFVAYHKKTIVEQYEKLIIYHRLDLENEETAKIFLQYYKKYQEKDIILLKDNNYFSAE